MTDLATTNRSRLTREYVAGSASSFVSNRMLRGLPWAFDDITRDFGDDLYERMQLDPQVAAVVNVLRSGIIEEGVTLANPLDDESADGFALADEIRGFCESVLNELTTPLDNVLWDLLSAVALGARVAEEVYTLTPAKAFSLPNTTPIQRNAELLILSALKPRPRHSVAFVVDGFMNVKGILGKPPGGAQIASSIVTDRPQSVPNLLPREKFAVLSFRPKDNDPRGTSALRPAYTPWWTKQQIWPEFLKYLAQFASPSIYAVASEAATAAGVTVQNDDGTYTTRGAVEVLLETLLAFQNGTAMAVPYGTILNALEVVGDGSAFHKAFTLTDQQIAMAVLHETLATLEAEHQSRASSETHQDTLDTLVRQAKRAVCLMLRRDVLRPMVTYNYGPDAARQLTPSVSLGSVERQDQAAFMAGVAALARSGYLDPSQYGALDRQMNLPPRDPGARPRPAPPPAPPEDDDAQDQGDADATR